MGCLKGCKVGVAEGWPVGCIVGRKNGVTVGLRDGWFVGCTVGILLG